MTTTNPNDGIHVKDYGRPISEVTIEDEKMTTAEMQEKYEVTGFGAPFVAVTRKADGVKGSLEFTHNPRFYFNFQPN